MAKLLDNFASKKASMPRKVIMVESKSSLYLTLDENLSVEERGNVRTHVENLLMEIKKNMNANGDIHVSLTGDPENNIRILLENKILADPTMEEVKKIKGVSKAEFGQVPSIEAPAIQVKNEPEVPSLPFYGHD